MLLEDMKYFKKIENIEEYVRNGILSGRMKIDEVEKFARIQARPGVVGEEIITKMENGLEETRNVVKIDSETGNPGWVVTNPTGEEYIIDDSTFQKKYEVDSKNTNQYKPKGTPVLSAQINEHIEFMAPWGENMKIEAGGFLIISTPSDIYGIQRDKYNNTYKSTQRGQGEVLNKVLDIFGISKEELEEARKFIEEKRNRRTSKSLEKNTNEKLEEI